VLGDKDVERLSPLASTHFNFLGRYRFSLPEALARGKFRPLRNPTEADDDFDPGFLEP